MSASEISGYIQIVLGLIGIFLTITNIRKLVPDINLFTGGNGVPPGLDNTSGFLRIVLLLCLLNITAFLICMGLTVTLSTLYQNLLASHAVLASSMTIASIIAMSVSSAMAMYRIRFWIPGFVGTVGAAACAIAAATSVEIEPFWVAAVLTLVLLAFTGLGVLVSFIE
jgi:hypothetical protein